MGNKENLEALDSLVQKDCQVKRGRKVKQLSVGTKDELLQVSQTKVKNVSYQVTVV